MYLWVATSRTARKPLVPSEALAHEIPSPLSPIEPHACPDPAAVETSPAGLSSWISQMLR